MLLTTPQDPLISLTPTSCVELITRTQINLALSLLRFMQRRFESVDEIEV